MNGYDRSADSKKASTGNDVVFLPATRPDRTVQPRFYSRILTAAEVEGYHSFGCSGLPFDQYVWLCWSVKESVYKYQKRLSPSLTFAPLRIGIMQMVAASGSGAYIEGIIGTLYSRSVIQDGVIVTVVSEDQTFTGTRWGFSKISSTAYADQSAAVRALVLWELKTVLSCADELRLQKDAAGCPIVLAGENHLMTPVPVSLAHHDRYIAYSYLNNVV